MFENVPEEILLTIFSMIPPHFLLNSISTCCKQWYQQVIKSDFLWMNYFVDYYGEKARREWMKNFINNNNNCSSSSFSFSSSAQEQDDDNCTIVSHWLLMFKEMSRRLNFRKILVRGNVVEMNRVVDAGGDFYKSCSYPLMKQNTYCLSDIPVQYKEGGYGGYHLYHPNNRFENLSYDIDLYISVNITNVNVDRVLRGELDLESSQIAKKMGGIIVRQETVEHTDLFGNQLWSIRLEPLLRFFKEKKNYMTRLVNCTNIYHYPRRNYIIMGINSTGIKVLNCTDGSLVWENEDGPNKKIHLNDAVNNSFGIVNSFCSEFKSFHAWNVENGDHLWSINLLSLFKNIKGVSGVRVKMRLKDVVSGHFLLQPMDDNDDPCYVLIHSVTGRVLAYFDSEVLLQMIVLSVEERPNQIDPSIQQQQVTTITNVVLYTVDRVCLLEFKNQHRKSNNSLTSMDYSEKWCRYLDYGSYSDICDTSYMWIPLDGNTIRKRRSERRDDTPLDELDNQHLFDLLFIHKVSTRHYYLERVRLDDGSKLYNEPLLMRTTTTQLEATTLNRAGNGPMNLNRESVSIFGEVRSCGELFLIIQTAIIDSIFVIDLESGSIKSILNVH